MAPPSQASRTAPEDWRAALELVADARITVVIGASDAGKTTLVAALASELAARGAVVGVVDADLGQSEIGPPTTVGLGRVRGPIARLSEAELLALHFVGVSSPALDVAGAVDGARRMTSRARTEGFERVLVDTSGLVAGGVGAALKRRKLEAIDPDLVLILDRDGDCEAVLRAATGIRARVVRFQAPGRPGSRSQAARRRHREAALERYLAGAGLISLDRSRLTVQAPNVGLDDWAGALCGLHDARGETLALGVVRDVSSAAVRTLAPLDRAEAVAALRIGRERRDAAPRAADRGVPPEGA